MQWKMLDAILEGDEDDELYVFLREAGIVFEMTVEEVMANTEITPPKIRREKEKGPAMPTPSHSV